MIDSSAKGKSLVAPLFDSHTHVYSEEFDVDREEVFERAAEKGVSMMLMPATDVESIRRTIAVHRKYPHVTRMAFGLHPESVDTDYRAKLREITFSLSQYRNDPALVAIGEIGLDFYWDKTYQQEQIIVLEKQLYWALKMNLPVILHVRNAHKEMVDLVARFSPFGLRGVFHSFTGGEEELRELLQFEGFMIGVNGIFTFKKSDELRKAIARIPADKLLLETDAPYLAPVPVRGKRNEPSFIHYTAEAIAKVLQVPLELLAQRTYRNAEKLFRK